MTKQLFAVCVLSFLIFSARADTIDYVHIYYNDVRIREYSGSGDSISIMIYQANMQPGDSLFIRYFSDTPCRDCATFLTAEDFKGQQVLSVNGRGTGNPVGFPVQALFDREYFDSTFQYRLYYYDKSKINVCTIQFYRTVLSASNTDDETWLLILGMLMVCVAMACVIAGALIITLIFLAIATLVSLGLLSASLLVGVWRKSFRKGYLTFLLLTGSVAGCAAGGIFLPLVNILFLSQFHLATSAVLITGLLGGLAGGCLTGKLIYHASGWLVDFFQKSCASHK